MQDSQLGPNSVHYREVPLYYVCTKGGKTVVWLRRTDDKWDETYSGVPDFRGLFGAGYCTITS